MSTTSTSAITPLTLNGISKYSTDYQSILNRAVAIAQQPLVQLQTQDSNVLAQNNALGAIQDDANNLLSSLQALGTLAANQAVGASSSDPTTVSATSTGGHHPGHLHDQFRDNPGQCRVGKIRDRLHRCHVHRGIRHGDAQVDGWRAGLYADAELEQPGGPARRYQQFGCARDRLHSYHQQRQLSVDHGQGLGLATALQLIDDPVTADNPGGANTELLTQTNQGQPTRSSR